jgi:hypothetical protein
VPRWIPSTGTVLPEALDLWSSVAVRCPPSNDTRPALIFTSPRPRSTASHFRPITSERRRPQRVNRQQAADSCLSTNRPGMFMMNFGLMVRLRVRGASVFCAVAGRVETVSPSRSLLRSATSVQRCRWTVLADVTGAVDSSN